jgi:hypothetical protein
MLNLLWLRSRLMFQEDLRGFARFVVSVEQAWRHVGRTWASHADDRRIAIVDRMQVGRIHGNGGIVDTQAAITCRGGGTDRRHLRWFATAVVGDHGEAREVIRTRRQRHDPCRQIALNAVSLPDVGIGEHAPVPTVLHQLRSGRELSEDRVLGSKRRILGDRRSGCGCACKQSCTRQAAACGELGLQISFTAPVSCW